MGINDFIRNIKQKRYIKKLIENNDFGNLVKFIKDNIENYEVDLDFVDEVFGTSAKRFLKVFDDNGNFILDNNTSIWTIIFNQKLKRILISVDSNWEKKFTPIQVQYIKYSLENPDFDDVFWYADDSDVDNLLTKYFDGEKIKDNIFDLLINRCPECGREFFKNPEYKKHFTKLEINYLMNYNNLDENFEHLMSLKSSKRELLPLYYDGRKLLPMYYHEIMFDAYFCDDIWENIHKYKKHYSKLQLAFIKKFRSNETAMNIFGNIGVNANNLSEFFYLENNNLKLQPKIAREWFDCGYYTILENIYEEDFSECELSENEIKILKIYQNINTSRSKETFLEILTTKKNDIFASEKKLESFLNLIVSLLNILEMSNSTELDNFKVEFIAQLLDHENPQKALEDINDVYTRNNLPIVAKVFLTFKILNKNYDRFDMDLEGSSISPILLQCKNDYERDKIIFSDLLKATLGSNNRSIRDYLLNIKEGNELFFKVKNNGLDSLSRREFNTLQIFVSHLRVLYNNTKIGKQKPNTLTGNLLVDIQILSEAFGVTERYDLPDRIIRMYGFFAGFKSFNEIWEYFISKREIADKRNRLNAEKITISGFKLQSGDFIKGIGSIDYLSDILQNGSVAKEFLGASSTSDATPLDTDLSRIDNPNDNLSSMIDKTKAGNYGPIWFVLKNKKSITVTRDEFGNKSDYDRDNLEAFVTVGNNHYGIRTGFASSEIDFIIIDNEEITELLPEIKHLLVINGFYVPIVDKNNGKLLFLPKEFDDMRKKLSGLRNYDSYDFQFSDNLLVDSEINDIINGINDCQKDADLKKKKINESIKMALKGLNLEFKDYFDYDINLGNVQLIDTGSTGRGTSIGKSSDFDFIMRIDSNTDIQDLKKAIMEALNIDPSQDTMKNLRLKNVEIPGVNEPVDIDISFVRKRNTNFYSTDIALKDRLEQIKTQDEKRYKEVLANIILAKKVLKEAKAYKPSHSIDASEGGLGGVGVENWILQHGGSFYDAAMSFVATAHGKTFEEFKKNYVIWDYGLNYYTGKFDEFVSGNMTEAGYKNMKKALEEYLKTVKVAEKDNSQTYEITQNNVDSYILDEGSLHR
ncbi:MAG: hypothetical protein E7161_03610 [Firmicutes bacterium]|nr:hypothetical protein [Bacillota bacterium]